MPATEKIKILFLAASPRDISDLRLDDELREIDKRIRMAKARDQFELISHWAVTPDDLHEILLRHNPHIVHFSGHGSKTQGIVLENKFGDSQMMSKSQLIDLFKILKDNIRIVVLNACYARRQAVGLSKIIDYTIGVRTAITDQTAILFAATFYQALAYERTVKDAFNLAKNRLETEGITRCDLPRLFVRKGVISSPIVVPDLLPATPDQPSLKSFLENIGQHLSQNIPVMRRRDLILTIAKIVAGIILIVGLYFAGRYAIGEWERLVRTQLYAKAVDQLGNQDDMIRAIGINGLGQLASDPNCDDDLYRRVIYELTTFIRKRSPLKTDGGVQSEILPDVQAALKVLGWRRHKWQDVETQALVLLSTNLKGADLRREEGMEGAHMEGALLNNVNLEGAKLRGINLQEANLARANLRGADLSGSDLEGAYLHLADLEGANLEKSNVTVAQLRLTRNCLRAALPLKIKEDLLALKEPCQ